MTFPPPNRHWLHASTIVGHAYTADLYCAACIRVAWDATATTAEEALDRAAERLGITRTDETSYDSNDFPTVVFANDASDDERCGTCQQRLLHQQGRRPPCRSTPSKSRAATPASAPRRSSTPPHRRAGSFLSHLDRIAPSAESADWTAANTAGAVSGEGIRVTVEHLRGIAGTYHIHQLACAHGALARIT